MTPADAQRLQDTARARGQWLMWFVAVTEGRARAWAVIADPLGGKRLPGELTADTLDQLRHAAGRADALGKDFSHAVAVLEVWD